MSSDSSFASGQTPARAERHALADLFAELGPDRPTLCEGWQTRELLAHLLIRERRPDALPGIGVDKLSGWTERVQRGMAAHPWDDLVADLRSGPPRWTIFGLPRVDEIVNTAEFFIHHEDVRRAQPDWEPRVLDPNLDRALWRLLCARGKTFYRKAAVGVTLRRDSGESQVVRAGTPRVVISGPAQEIALHAFGRRTAAQVRIEGEPAAVAALSAPPSVSGIGG